MLHFLLFFFILVLVGLLFGFSVIGAIIRSIFGTGPRRSSEQRRQSHGNYTQRQDTYRSQENGSFHDESTFTQGGTSRKRKKIFDKDEGEYVDFEEIKE